MPVAATTVARLPALAGREGAVPGRNDLLHGRRVVTPTRSPTPAPAGAMIATTRAGAVMTVPTRVAIPA